MTLLRVKRNLFLLFLNITTLCYLIEASCTYANGKYDLTTLDGPTPWYLHTENGSDFQLFEFSLCKPIASKDECDNTRICQKVDEHNFVVLAKGDVEPTFQFVSEKQGFWLEYLGPTCSSDAKRLLRTAINFQCANKIGLPQFLYKSECTYYFLWQTNAACEVSKAKKRKEVSCYVFDDEGKKRDLSPLTLENGSHRVKTGNPALKFFINVCAAINDTSVNCAEGSGACRKIGSEVIDFGRPEKALGFTDGNPTLTYTLEKSDEITPSGCSLKPKTTITFRCPHDKERDARRTYARVTGPSLILTSNCEYQVEWVTEYACPVKELTTTTDCKLHQSDLGIHVDLKSLTLKDDKYQIHTTYNGQEVDFFMNICADVPKDVCSTKTGACLKLKDNKVVNIGSAKSRNLKFSDGELILSYRDGDACPNGTNERYSTVIIFQCGSETKNPVFNQLIDCTYFFNWESKLACLDLATGSRCLARDDSKIIDLSSLIKHTGNWDAVTTNVESFSSADIIVNVCGPIDVPSNFTGCAFGTAICLKEGKKFANLGRFESEPKIVGNNAVITYTNGDACDSGSKTMSSVITFKCEPGESNHGPSLISVSKDECTFEFEWKTSAGCVQSRHVGQDCRVFDPELGYSFDLTPLREMEFKAKLGTNSTEYEYYISVCGAASVEWCKSLGSYAACQVKTSDRSKVWSLGLPSSNISYFDGFINLTYTGGTPFNDEDKTARQSRISFVCDPDAGKGQPEFVAEEKQIYNFKWYTSLACPKRPIECLVTDRVNRKQYDLSSLIQKPGSNNWEIVAEFNLTRKKFYLNICQPLVGKIDGCAPQTSSCIKTLVDGREENYVGDAGHAVVEPYIEAGEIIALKYDMGEECKGSGKSRNYTTIINLFCDKETTVLKPPVFLRSLGKCTFHFMWETGAACPITLDSTNDSTCAITDTATGFRYDLQPLRGVYSINTLPNLPYSSIQLSLCGAEIQGACRGSSNVSACGNEENSKTGRVLGVSTYTKIEIGETERIVVKYSKPVPIDTGNPEYVVIVNLNCRPEVRKGDMKFIRLQDEVLYFEMDTNVACAPKQIECTTWDHAGNQYDLSSLVRSDTNWEVIDTRQQHNDLKYYINVCKPLYLGDGKLSSKCEVGAAGCQVTGDGRNFSLGVVGGPPQVRSSGQLTLKYRDGSLCHGGKFKRSATILLECSNIQHDPVFVDETPECEYIISWSTPAACPIKKAVGSDCHVDDTQFGHRFDLSQLKQISPVAVDGGDHTYLLAVCKDVQCKGIKNVGVCQKANLTDLNAGLFNEKLLFNDGELSLEYTDGEANCHGQFSRTSIIRFVCNPLQQLGRPNFVKESSNCTYLFVWETSAACAPVITSQCSVSHNGDVYDLSSLTLYDQSHEVVAADGKQKFLINVCRSLIQSRESRCKYTSGVCSVNLSEDDPKLKFKDIGNVHRGPYFEDGFLKLKYEFGENCDSGPSEAVITFSCDHSRLDTEPQFLRKDGCVWHFMWSTSAACAVKSEENVKNDCTVVNPQSGFQFDLNPLSNSSGYFAEDAFKPHKYMLNVCNELSQSLCGSGVGGCQQDTASNRFWNMGKSNSKLHYHNGIILLNYTDGTPCHQGAFNRSTVVQFICDPTGGKGVPIFIEETNNCTYYFTWHTELACENTVHCMVDTGSNVVDLSSLTKTSNYFAVPRDESDESVYMLSVCRPLNPEPSFPCPAESAACLTATGQAKPVSLGQVSKSPEVDGQGRVYLTYTRGSDCPNRPGVRISSKIIFICDQNGGIGTPMLMDKSDCVYTFEWQTGIACSRNSNTNLKLENCVFTDSKAQIVYDLNSLAKTTQVQDEDISINICGSVSDSGSCAESSVCKGRETSYGLTSSLRSFTTQENALRLHYSNGSECKIDGPTLQPTKWSSEIWFMCDPSTHIGSPVVINRLPCYVYMHWKTSAVCSHSCVVFGSDGKVVDLGPLGSISHIWNATDGNGNTYWINVCHGLRSKSLMNSNCPPDATVCMNTSTGGVKVLGVLDNQKLKFNETRNSVEVTYSAFAASDACSSNKIPKVSIDFTCANGVGVPEFVEKDDDSCLFTFRWPSWTACPEMRSEEEIKLVSGFIENPKLQLRIDFSQLLQQEFEASEVRGNDAYTYKISLGNHAKLVCGVNGVCQTKGDGFQRVIGLTDGVKVFRRGEQIQMELPSNSKCGSNPSKYKSTVITFECNQEDKLGNPEFIFESNDCKYNFNWRTNAVCLKNVRFGKSANESNQSKSLSTGAIFFIVGSLLTVVIVIAVILSNSSRRSYIAYKCRQVWRNARRSPSFRYSRLPATEHESERTLLLNPEDGQVEMLQEDSDDEVLEI